MNNKNVQMGNINLIIGPTRESEARRLRSEGCSLSEINKALDIPVTSLRRIIKDIKLTEEQKIKLLTKKRKRSRKVIKLNYNDGNIIIDGKINLRVSKRKRFHHNLEELIIRYILEQL
jgi:DNA-binding transcriptional MerR regulator